MFSSKKALTFSHGCYLECFFTNNLLLIVPDKYSVQEPDCLSFLFKILKFKIKKNQNLESVNRDAVPTTPGCSKSGEWER